jgi:hypothetical protein
MSNSTKHVAAIESLDAVIAESLAMAARAMAGTADLAEADQRYRFSRHVLGNLGIPLEVLRRESELSETARTCGYKLAQVDRDGLRVQRLLERNGTPVLIGTVEEIEAYLGDWNKPARPRSRPEPMF